MLAQRPINKSPAWLAADESSPAGAVLGQLSLVRNLADFPFPERCTAEERRQVEQRVLGVLESAGFLSGGAYHPLADIEPLDARLLAERRLIAPGMLAGREGRGVFVSEDQCVSVMVNADDHLCMRVLVPAAQVDEGWERLSRIDDTLTGLLDFAFDDQLGFLTCDLRLVGTGLKAMLMLHLPTLKEASMLDQMSEQALRQRFALTGVRPGAGMDQGGRTRGERLSRRAKADLEALDESLCVGAAGSLHEAAGDLFTLTNTRTLGMSEAEIVFHLRHLAEDLLQQENEARETLTRVTPLGVQDRVGRARGIAGGAYMLDFAEALGLLSSLRLGVAAGYLPAGEAPRLNGLLLRAQRAHLETALGREGDALSLNAERARLFRSHFGASPEN